MKKTSTFLFALLSACLLFAGCSTPSRVGGINVTVVGFKADETSTVATHAIMTLRFTSENVNPVALTSTSHELYLAKHLVAKAENATAVGIPPLGTMTLDVHFNLDDPGIVRQILSVSDEPPYRLESTLFFTEDDSKRRVKVSAEGKVAIQGLEQAAR